MNVDLTELMLRSVVEKCRFPLPLAASRPKERGNSIPQKNGGDECAQHQLYKTHKTKNVTLQMSVTSNQQLRACRHLIACWCFPATRAEI